MRRACRIQMVLPYKVLAIGSGILIATAPVHASAEASLFNPQTKFRLSVVQWSATKGQFERWDALDGEYTVSAQGEVFLPSLGPLPVGQFDIQGLTNEIAIRLQRKIHLNQAPSVTVEIIEHAPIYVVGDVTRPGEYRYRAGMTALQAVALGGGPIRALPQQRSQAVKLSGDLRELDAALVRKNAKLARLHAEMAGEKEIGFDPAAADQPETQNIFNEERVIFKARANALDRQSKALTELRGLLSTEIVTLEEKLKGSDNDIRSIEDQLTSVKALVDRGITLASRQLDLERLLTTYRSNRLDLVTAVMRGRQAVSETTRNLEGLYDARRSEVAFELQAEQASLEQLQLKRDTTQKLILEELSVGAMPNVDRTAHPPTFAISRRDKEQVREIQAAETTILEPGDVVRVIQPISPDALVQTAAPPVANEAQPDQASQ